MKSEFGDPFARIPTPDSKKFDTGGLELVQPDDIAKETKDRNQRPESWEPGVYGFTLTEGENIDGIPNRDDVNVVVDMNVSKEQDVDGVGEGGAQFFLSRGFEHAEETLRITDREGTFNEMYQDDVNLVLLGGVYVEPQGYYAASERKKKILDKASTSREGFLVSYTGDTYSIKNLNLRNDLFIRITIDSPQDSLEQEEPVPTL